MSVNVHHISMEIRTLFARNVITQSANANLHTNSLVAVAFWLDVKMVESARLALNAFRLLAESVIVHVQKVTALNQTVLVLMSTSVQKVSISADSEPFVSIGQATLNVFAHQDTMAIHIMVNAQHHNEDVQQIVNAEQMRSVYSPVNVFVHHHFSWIFAIITSVRILANVSHAESMPNVHHPIHHNVCVK